MILNYLMRNDTMKKFSALLLAILMLFSLCACGGNQGATSSDDVDTNSTTNKTENTSSVADVPMTKASFTSLDTSGEISTYNYKIIKNNKTLEENIAQCQYGAETYSKEFPQDAIIEVTLPDENMSATKHSLSVWALGMKFEFNAKKFKKLTINLPEKRVQLDCDDSDLELKVCPSDGFGVDKDKVQSIEITGKGQIEFSTPGDGKTFRVKHSQAIQTSFVMRALNGYMDTLSLDKEYEVVITDFTPDNSYEYTYNKIS